VIIVVLDGISVQPYTSDKITTSCPRENKDIKDIYGERTRRPKSAARGSNTTETKSITRTDYQALDLNSSWVMSRMKKPFWKRLFLGGSNNLLLLLGLGFSSSPLMSHSPFPEVTGFSPPTEGRVSTCEGVGIGRFVIALVPIAFEIESKGRIGFETGNDGIRRGKVGEVSAAVTLVKAHGKPFPDPREIAPDEWARRAGRLEKTGSTFSFVLDPESLESEDCGSSS
jgi:hypothetical protein